MAVHSIGQLEFELRPDTQTLSRLSPTEEPGFSFVPSWLESERSGDGYNHIGDLNLRVRAPGSEWRDFSSSTHRKPIHPLPAEGEVIAAADITATMGEQPPFRVERVWARDNGRLALRFRITNVTEQALEIGVLGMPMVFDNIIDGRTLDEAHTRASFADPYIGRDAGYVQVTRLNGEGPALLVLPESNTALEAYKPLKQPDKAPNSIFTDRSSPNFFEGFYDWTVYSRGYVEREWRDAGRQWNTPGSETLAPGETAQFGLQFVQSPTIRAIEETLIAHQRPVAVGLPGYIVPANQSALLFVRAPSAIEHIDSDPAGALEVSREGSVNGWTKLKVKVGGWGRARLTLGYADGQQQTISYYLVKPLSQAVADLGHFATTEQWYDNPDDPFGRAPAILSYDSEAGGVVLSDWRMWIPGMSDEGGAGSWMAAIAKQLNNPDPQEIAKLERLTDETVIGRLQVAEGEHAGAIKKSLVWFDPERFADMYPGYAEDPERFRWSWDKEESDRLDRSYNYPWPAINHWVLYRLARNHEGLVKRHDWQFYLDNAYRVAVAMPRDAELYAEFGLMGGEVFLEILKDLQREGMTDKAEQLESLMRERAEHWHSLEYPFGSEMPWDSTGQPEVYAWMRYFGFDAQAEQTREVILGYDPTIPGWGYNGNARRYWDFGTAGKYERFERQIHHYGSALNAVPLLDAFRRDPSDFHLLRVGYGGMMGPMASIHRNGFTSTAFHAWPDMMKWDPYSGDYGMGFFGHAYAIGTYVVNHPTFGWLALGGELQASADSIRVVPLEEAQKRLFIAPAGQWITLQAGRIQSATYQSTSGDITLTLAPADDFTSTARVFLQATTDDASALRVADAVFERGGYSVPLSRGETTIRLVP
ncbi:DUF5695 domain-containing protein [Kushneria aurantia]|uniref:DUF5695 domain-containing protein n=1 Tax=Kushneria aurantia TaxID=504092 RepID=A0ABV6G527_9GAMM|nr:DUF5695 domain-containing protein [Kushneria aurantia]